MIGLAQGAFDKAVPYTYQRIQFGKPVGTFQGMQFQIAQAAADIAAARLLVYNAARRKEEGKTFTKEAAIAKLIASQVAQRVSGAAIEWCGGVGFTRETGIEKYWRDSKIVRFSVNAAKLCMLTVLFIRVLYTKGHPTFNCRLSGNLYRRSIRNQHEYIVTKTHCNS